jgi:hypothetical protein
MGEANSSVTRVWPVFDTLFASDPSGEMWLTKFLGLAGNRVCLQSGTLISALGKFDKAIPGNLTKVLGEDRVVRLGNLRSCFEADYPPSTRFLRWLLENSDKLMWPTAHHKAKGKVARMFEEPTQSLRTRLIAGDRTVRDEALDALSAKGAAGSRRKWWAFEGFTSVDCVLETDRLIVFIEGKRTEPISAATDWYPQRNQIVRNVEVASCAAMETRKDFGVILCAETPVELSEQAFKDGLPHLSEAEQQGLRAHYWGCITWQQVVDELCPSLVLPSNLEEAVRICERLRL